MSAPVSNTDNVATEGGSQWEEPVSAMQDNDAYSVKRKQSLQARYVYGFIFFTTNLFAWFIRDYGHKIFARLHRKSLLNHYKYQIIF